MCHVYIVYNYIVSRASRDTSCQVDHVLDTRLTLSTVMRHAVY